jgi:hypothetical protein
VAQFPGQGGLNSGPLPNEKSSTCEPAQIENASAPAESIEKDDFKNLIDRIQNSKKADFEEEVFEAARNLIASHHAKFARDGCQLPGKPDDQITAQFLAVADWPRLSRTLHDLLTERQSTSFSWGWYVTVALQRIHGISPDRVRGIRERLRKPILFDVGSRDRMHTHSSSAWQSSSTDISPFKDHYRQSNGLGALKEQVRILAASKSLR